MIRALKRRSQPVTRGQLRVGAFPLGGWSSWTRTPESVSPLTASSPCNSPAGCQESSSRSISAASLGSVTRTPVRLRRSRSLPRTEPSVIRSPAGRGSSVRAKRAPEVVPTSQ